MKYSTKNILFSFLLCGFTLTFSNCKNKPTQTIRDPQHYSKNQEYLFQLLDKYKSEYFAASRKDLKDSVQKKYLVKLHHFLVDSLGRYIDSMTVIVDTLIQESWLVTTQFHARDIEFKYGMKFKDNMDSKDDSFYHFMIALKPKSEVTLNFILLGSAELNYPDDSTKRALRIFGYPEPLKPRPK